MARILATLVLVFSLSGVTVLALEGAGGSTVTELFDVSDVATNVVYPTGFGGVEWADLDQFSFGSPGGSGGYEQGDDLAADGAGSVFVIVNGSDTSSSDAYTGLIVWDGTGFLHLVQDKMVVDASGGTTGDMLRTVTISPASAGALTAGHPVVTRHHKTVTDQVELEIWSVDPATGAETLVHSWTTSALNPEAILAIGEDGTIYALGGVAPPTASIRVLAWNASTSSYDERILTSGQFGHGLTMGPDGYLYTFARSDEWRFLVSPYPDHEVLRVDPTTGSYGAWAYVDGESFIWDWTVGTDGKLWIGLRQLGQNRKKPALHFVAQVSSGSTTGPDGRISDSRDDPQSLAAAPDGALYVLERSGLGSGAVYLLTPGDGGGSGGGGGKGGGKGNNK